MPISQYRSLLEQSLNIGILISGGKFKMTSEKDDRLELEWEYNELIKQGKLKHGK